MPTRLPQSSGWATRHLRWRLESRTHGGPGPSGLNRRRSGDESEPVLDLGCGDGTTAIPEAQLGADVLGVDIARNLVQAGNKRVRELGLTNIRFQEGDACDLGPLEDHSFDLVVSIFGAMFAPKPFEVAKEMVRVTRPGGHIVMGNWIPGDPTLVAQILKISSAYSPPPPEGFVSPMTWGIESNVVERFTAAGVPKDSVSCTRDTFVFDFDGAPAQSSQNKSGSESRTSVNATFLRVTVTMP